MSLPRPAIVQSTIYLWCFRLPYDKQPFLVSDILMAVRRVQPSSTAPAGLHATPRDVIGPDPSMRRYPGVVVLTHPPQREKERKKKKLSKNLPQDTLLIPFKYNIFEHLSLKLLYSIEAQHKLSLINSPLEFPP